jgi:hypothetical protein
MTHDYFKRMEGNYQKAQVITRVMMIGMGFGLGWLLSQAAWSPESAWWLFWVPAGMLTAFAVSGFVADILPLPRPLVYLALLGAGLWYALTAEHDAGTEPSAATTEHGTATAEQHDDPAVERRFGFTVCYLDHCTMTGGLKSKADCEAARPFYEREGLTVRPCKEVRE